ncbi:MAG: hypothetical protein KVP17_002583 [Porospora cf. gigantea B]|uniref:uncharacterized protein n=2 Tax=Porospora cf. gigantea B TaxID=2853592 RepID=UPI003571B6B4|nr:MAG: hypothetical protein KVP17_002583 [Porospora cf. gigantea B]
MSEARQGMQQALDSLMAEEETLRGKRDLMESRQLTEIEGLSYTEVSNRLEELDKRIPDLFKKLAEMRRNEEHLDEVEWQSTLDDDVDDKESTSFPVFVKQADSDGRDDTDPENWLSRLSAFKDSHSLTSVAPGFQMPTSTWDALFDHQKRGLEFLVRLEDMMTGGLLADEMGLGKTITLAAYLLTLYVSARPLEGILIVCPVTLVRQWVQELHRWCPPLRVLELRGKSSQARRQTLKLAAKGGVLLASYESVRIFRKTLLSHAWSHVILDEGQKIRNPESETTLALKSFSSRHRLILTGSPIQNSLRELWSLFDFCVPGLLGTLPVFKEHFTVPINKGGLAKASPEAFERSYACAKALKAVISPYILRRTKSEVSLSLPEKRERVLFCRLTAAQYASYLHILESHDLLTPMALASYQSYETRKKVKEIENEMRAQAFGIIAKLRKVCNHPEMLKEPTERHIRVEDSGKTILIERVLDSWFAESAKALIFSQSLDMLDALEDYMTTKRPQYTFLRLDGSVNIGKRTKLVDEFNSSKDVFAMLLTTQVGGVGLNLMGANRVLIVDPDWNPVTDTQARERSWRIGQANDVVIYRLITSHTIEEKILKRQVFKQFLSMKVLEDARQKRNLTYSDLKELFELPPPPREFHGPQQTKAELLSTADPGLRNEIFGSAAEAERSEGEVTPDESPLSQDLPSEASPSADPEIEPIISSLLSSGDLESAYEHGLIDQPGPDQELMRREAADIALQAVNAIRESQTDRLAYGLEIPTWTGRRGAAGKPAVFGSARPEKRVPSAEVLASLKRLRHSPTARAVLVHKSDIRLAEDVLSFFQAREGHATTGEVLDHFGTRVPDSRKDVFKAILTLLCDLTKTQPAVWGLKEEHQSLISAPVEARPDSPSASCSAAEEEEMHWH